MDYLIQNTDLYTKTLLIVFLVSFFIQAWYYLVIYTRASKESKPLKNKTTGTPPVSVIICARNEAVNLEKHLPSVLEQDYPDFEVIVVNDCSEDETETVLAAFQKRYKVLKVSTIKKDPVFSHGKKLALTIGIKASSNEHLLFTDADCEVASKSWIHYMVRHFNDQVDIVTGIGLYKKAKGLLNLFIRFDTAYIAMQYTALARYGRPYMGVGRNLAYKKSLFFKHKGFASHSRLRSGDDDLFVGEASTKNNTVVENHLESITWSEPEKRWSDWFSQKRRHLTTGKFYQQSVRRLLGTEYLSRTLLNISFLLLLFRPDLELYVIGVYILMIITKAIIFNIAFRRLYENYLFLPSLLIEPFVPLFYGLMHIGNYIERKRNRWN
ncbi:MAG TPA: glycosyltransferase [Bacteroidales bacterium]|nr:glycosyltransferase [Bacteroidales bacterium]